MATITLNIPDAMLPRVTAALCASAGVPDTNANAKAQVVAYIKQVVKNYEADQSAVNNNIDVS